MLIHIIPKIFNRYRHIHVGLIDVALPEFGLTLRNGSDVTIGRPYPNKGISVVRLTGGRKAVEGFFLKVDNDVQAFTVLTRWALNAEAVLLHRVEYSILDDDYGWCSQNPVLWSATGDDETENRWVGTHRTPCKYNPTMTVVIDGRDDPREGLVKDEYAGDILKSRVEKYAMPTIKKNQLFRRCSQENDRMPSPDTALICTVTGSPKKEIEASV